MAHQLHSVEISLNNVTSTALNITMQVSDSLVVPIFISLIDDFVTSFHCSELSNSQILLEALQTL